MIALLPSVLRVLGDRVGLRAIVVAVTEASDAMYLDWRLFAVACGGGVAWRAGLCWVALDYAVCSVYLVLLRSVS